MEISTKEQAFIKCIIFAHVPQAQRELHMGRDTGAMIYCGPLWKQSNTWVIRGTKENKARGRGFIESDRAVISDMEVRTNLSEEVTIRQRPVQ